MRSAPYKKLFIKKIKTDNKANNTYVRGTVSGPLCRRVVVDIVSPLSER